MNCLRFALVGLCFSTLIQTAVAQDPRFTLTKLVSPAGAGEVSLSPQPGLDGKYSSGTQVSLTAHAAPGWAFHLWTPGAPGHSTIGTTSNPKVVTMNENRTLTANYVTSSTPDARFTLTRIVSPSNTGEIAIQPPPGTDGKYSSGTLVTLTAHPIAGRVFTSWAGAVTGDQNPKQLLINSNKTVTANFGEPRATLTKIVNPAGAGEIGVQPLPGPDGKYTSGTMVTLTAFPAAGKAFSSWSGAVTGTVNPKQLLLNGSKTVTANFVTSTEPPRFALTRIVNPPGSGEISVQPPPGLDGKYTSGTLVTVTAHPAAGKVFNSWSGAATGSTNPRQILMNENKTVTANFTSTEHPRFTLTRIVNPAGAGEISVQPPPGLDGKYTSGTVVTLTAHPAPGRTFIGWSGGATGNNNPRPITMTENKTVTANFSGESTGARFTLVKTVTPAGAGEVSVSPAPGSDGKYSSGTLVTVTAHAFAGYAFSHWAGASTLHVNPVQFRMTENKGITAVFENVAARTANLMVQLVPSKNPVLLGTKFVMNIHVANDGPSTATATRFELRVPLSYTFTSSTISQGSINILPNATFVGNLGLLPPGGHAHAALLLQPQTTGTLESHASVQAEQSDPNPLNNQAHIAVRVIRELAPAPDLSGQAGTIARKTLTTGSKITGNFVFSNDGSAISQKSTLQYFLSSDETLDPLDTLVQTQAIGALRPGKALKKKFNLKLPANAEGRRVIGVLDAGEANEEGDEVNNTVVSPPVP